MYSFGPGDVRCRRHNDRATAGNDPMLAALLVRLQTQALTCIDHDLLTLNPSQSSSTSYVPHGRRSNSPRIPDTPLQHRPGCHYMKRTIIGKTMFRLHDRLLCYNQTNGWWLWIVYMDKKRGEWSPIPVFLARETRSIMNYFFLRLWLLPSSRLCRRPSLRGLLCCCFSHRVSLLSSNFRLDHKMMLSYIIIVYKTTRHTIVVVYRTMLFACQLFLPIANIFFARHATT